jgi:hypothetical protein
MIQSDVLYGKGQFSGYFINARKHNVSATGLVSIFRQRKNNTYPVDNGQSPEI